MTSSHPTGLAARESVQRTAAKAGVMDFVRSRIAFARANIGLAAGIAIALVLSYGFALTNFALSIDEEVHLWKDFTFGWMQQGRPTVTLVKLALGEFLPLPFVDLSIALIFILASFLLWLSLFEEAAGRKVPVFGAAILFGVFYTTLPINFYFLAFNTYNVEVSFGLVLSALAVSFTWRWGMLGGGWPAAILSILFSFLAAGTYQSLVVLCLAGLIGVFCVHRTADGVRDPSPARGLGRIVLMAVPLLAGAFGSVLFARLVLPSDGYTEAFMQWGKATPSEILDSLMSHVAMTFAGGAFVGGWVVSATVVAGLLVLLLSLRRAFLSGDWLMPLLVVALLVMPFMLSFAVGMPLPKRSQQALPLSYGVVWLLLAFFVPRKPVVSGLFIVAALLLGVWNAQANTRLSFSRYLAFQSDKDLAAQIASALRAAGWDGTPLPVVSVGKPAVPERRYRIIDETIGASFFGWGEEGRGMLLMYILGYELSAPTAEQAAEGYRLAETMPAWPRPGSVIVRDGIGIVNFGTH